MGIINFNYITAMKKVKYLTLLFAASMFAACSDNLNDTGSGNTNGSISDKGYIRVALNLPTTSGGNSRAANDQFNNGIDAEYKVNNAILVLFTGTDEARATYSQAFEITPTLQSGPGINENVTTRYTTASIEINKPASGNVYGLVILNNNGLFNVAQGATSGKADQLQWKSSESSGFTNFSGNLSQLNNTAYNIADVTTIANSTATTGGFLMTNAPKAAVKGTVDQTTQNVTTLVQLTIRDSEDDADAAAPDEIYVERAVAKTTVKVDTNSGTALEVEDGDFAGATVEFESWLLNTTNKVTYLVRNVADWEEWARYTMPTGATAGSGNRFFGNDAAFYRVYWAIDPNYRSKDDTNLSTYQAGASLSWPESNIDNNVTASGSEHPQYCLENTTSESYMLETELTGVLFKAKFTPDGATDGSNFFMLANKSEIYTEENFVNLVNTILGAGTISASNISGEGGTYTTKETVASWLRITEENAQDLLNDSHIGGDIKFYKGGVCYYYSAFIKHFGDDLTPFRSGTYTAADHLGRYGVVRNNWYELNITKVTGPGSPEIPEPDDEKTPDDTESWIRCAINVLSWAKRSQDVEL